MKYNRIAVLRLKNERNAFQLIISANDKGDKEVKLGALYRSPGLRKTSETKTGRPSHEGCRTNFRLKWGPLPPSEVDRIAQHVGERSKDGMREGRKKTRKEGRKDCRKEGKTSCPLSQELRLK